MPPQRRQHRKHQRNRMDVMVPIEMRGLNSKLNEMFDLTTPFPKDGPQHRGADVYLANCVPVETVFFVQDGLKIAKRFRTQRFKFRKIQMDSKRTVGETVQLPCCSSQRRPVRQHCRRRNDLSLHPLEYGFVD